MYHQETLLFPIGSVFVATDSFKIAELRKLTEVTLGCGGIEASVTDDGFCREWVFIGYKRQNIDQFLYQRGFYRPFLASSAVYRPISLLSMQ